MDCTQSNCQCVVQVHFLGYTASKLYRISFRPVPPRFTRDRRRRRRKGKRKMLLPVVLGIHPSRAESKREGSEIRVKMRTKENVEGRGDSEYGYASISSSSLSLRHQE